MAGKQASTGMEGAHRGSRSGFTLVEVMIAAGILFACLFAILAVVSNSLRGARMLQQPRIDATLLAAEASINQKLSEGSGSGDLEELLPGYRFSAQTNLLGSNGLYQVDFALFKKGGDQAPVSHLSILLYRLDSGMGGRR